MSQEVSIFKNGSSIPAHLRKKELSAATKALMGGSSGKRLSIRGGVFRIISNGQEIMRSEDRAMNIIVVAVAPKTSRHFYIEPYQEGMNVKPDCWSNDGEKPDPLCETKQNNICLGCPQNIAGSGQGDSRACRYLHRLAVILENDIQGDVYGLSLAATSIFGKGDPSKMPMGTYAKLLGSHGMDITDVVTEMRFDTDSATPKLTFRAVRPLDEDEIETVIEAGESEEAHAAISFTDVSVAPVVEKQPLFAKIEEPAPAAKFVPVEEEPQPVPSPKRRTTRAELTKPAEVIEEPVKRAVAAKAEVSNLDDILGEWGEA